ncbi:hypothetical protein ACO2Q2_01600 [Dyella sp. KRB-257]|uniref:hypothetical protein n=1 Tax=Dyella sp. KRB-257 TaxID=3400915 RepID=UPI003C06719C
MDDPVRRRGCADLPVHARIHMRARRLGDPWNYVVASVLTLLLFAAITLLVWLDAAV